MNIYGFNSLSIFSQLFKQIVLKLYKKMKKYELGDNISLLVFILSIFL